MTSGFFGGAWEGGEVPGYNWLFSLPSFSLLAFFFLHCREEEQEGANREISRRVEMIMAPEAEGVQRGGVACVPLPHFLYFSFFFQFHFIRFRFVSFLLFSFPFFPVALSSSNANGKAASLKLSFLKE